MTIKTSIITRRALRFQQSPDCLLYIFSLQRRCYWEDEGGWRVGRIVWQGDGEYGVRPPDSEVDIRVAETDLYVRWNRPIEDPIDVLVAHGNESPYFHLCRRPFMATVIEQRAASHGMHGVVSAIVDLHNHQIEVVRRVLEDPNQRYLLADEVGLGKTIEAGFIIRQYLLDHPNGHVVVVVPPLLRRQWVSELREKFLIDDFDHAVVSVLSHDNPESWRGGASDGFGRYSLHCDAGLVVVDEVHHLAVLAQVGADNTSSYAALAELARSVPRLLLLSATPLLHNEQTFLAMLHLLDPDIYALDDIDGFRRRVRDRQILGTAFFTFRHDIPPFLLREKVSCLRGMFPEDGELTGRLNAVIAAINDPVELREAVTAARIHISEAYRVHRRLLRTRRSEALLSTFPVRGRQRPTPLVVAGSDTSAQDWLDDWREYVRSVLGDDEPSQRDPVRRTLIALAERAGSHPPLLAAAARFRLDPSPAKASAAALTVDEQLAIGEWEVDDNERQILERGLALAADVTLIESLVSFLKGERKKTVIFASFTATAAFVHDALAEQFGPAAIASHFATDTPADVEAELGRFKDGTGNCWILICDRSAEEGRNLQFTDQAIHFDLPLSPNRLEQRIGRLDRFGRGSLISTYSLVSMGDTIASAWGHCLSNGFGVFDASIASLQFAVDALLPEVFDALLDDGPEGLLHITNSLPIRLDAEREAIAEQDALDAIEVPDHMGELATAMDDLEDMWFKIQRATEGLLCEEPGNLRFHRTIDREDDRYRSYRLTAPGKAPHLNSMPLVAWDVLRSTFRPLVERPGTYFRRAATALPGVRLFRVGEPLIDGLTDYVRWDDRGQAFALWRPTSVVVDETLYFRFDYVITADTTRAKQVVEASGTQLDRQAVQRRSDAFFRPTVASVWSTLDAEELDDPAILALVERPYDPDRGDVNLNHQRHWVLDELVGEADWEPRCRTARAASEGILRGQPWFGVLCQSAALRFEAASRVSIVQRQVRLGFVSQRQRVTEEVEMETQVGIDAALADGMQRPRVRLDAVGVVVLSHSTPEGPGFDRRRP